MSSEQQRKRILHSGGMMPPSFGPIRSHCGREFPNLSSFAVIGKRGNVSCKNCLRATAKSRAYWLRQIRQRKAA